MINMIATASFEPATKGGFSFRESPEIDQYADLFASLFTVPVAMPPELAKAVPEVGGKTDSLLSQETIDGTVAFAVPTVSGAESSNNSVDLLRLFPEGTKDVGKPEIPVINPAILEPSPKQVSFLGPPIKVPPPEIKPIEPGPFERLPIKVGNDVCGIPGGDPRAKSSTLVRRTGVSQTLDVDLYPIDYLPLNPNEHDHPVELEVLEIPNPIDYLPLRRSKDVHPVKLEVLEIATPIAVRPNSEPEPVLEVEPGLVNKNLSPVPPASEPTPINPVEPSLKAFLEPKQKEKITVSLLETFTNTTFVDGQVAEQLSVRPSSKGKVEGATVFTEFGLPNAEKPKGEMATEFSFGSSFGGDKATNMIERPLTSEFKLNRIILDQVGSRLTDLAMNLREGGDKKVFKIRLKPAELGTVEITLAKNADGRIDAHFQTDNPHTQHILKETLNQLRASLEQSGLQVGELNTSCTSFSSGGQDSNGGPERQFNIEDDHPIIKVEFDTNSKTEDDKNSRLVSLRA